MVSGGDLLDVFRAEFLGAAVDEVTEVARVNEQDFAPARVSKHAINHPNNPEKCYIFSGFFMGNY